jgi:hypothetical protein
MIKTILAIIVLWYVLRLLNLIPIARWLDRMLNAIWNQKMEIKVETLKRIRELHVDGNVYVLPSWLLSAQKRC